MSLYLLDARACFDREENIIAQVHIIYNSRSLTKLYKAKTNNKKSGLIIEKINKLDQASQNSTVHHEASTFGTEALMSKNINSLSSLKSETHVVQD